MKTVQYQHKYSIVDADRNTKIIEKSCFIKLEPKQKNKLGVMLVGMGGNNGSTLLAGILAYKKKLSWNNKSGEKNVQFLGSVSQYGSVHIGYDSNQKPHSKLFKDIGDMYDPNDIFIGGWDICGDNMYEAAKKSKVIDYDLLNKLKSDLECIVPLPSVYNSDFIASNQEQRANNIIISDRISSKSLIEYIKHDIETFKCENDIDKVVVVWTASTERFHKGNWKNRYELYKAIDENNREVSPSILFAAAAAETGCIFLNGSPQNTICPAVIDNAKYYKTFVGGEDFKTGQTKLKSVLVDWLASSGIKPLSIVSYNHLGNNDGKNLNEEAQFRSKEITKKNVIDDIVEENPVIFSDGKPDHAVVIKYVPAVGDSKRAMDEYYSEIFLGGKHTLAIHNTCEDSLLAVPLILDIILFSEFFSRVTINDKNFDTVLSMLSLFFKAPVVNENEPLVNSFFKQKNGLENFFRILLDLPPNNHLYFL
jgi:myo-inositol-1-phosphate synthase